MPKKSFILSRTVWFIVAMIAVGLFGLFGPERNAVGLPADQLRGLCAVLLVILGGCAIYCRSTAHVNLRYGDGDGQMSTLLAAPLVLMLCLSAAGCVKSESGAELTPLDHAKVVIGTLNDTYVPARTVYEEVYNLASEETQQKLRASVNPLVNKATDTLATATTLLIMWAKTNERPAEMDEVMAKATAAVPEAIKAMSTAVLKPVPKKE